MTAPVFPVLAVLPRVPVPCAPHAASICRAVLSAASRRVAVTARGQHMHAVAVAAPVRSAHQADGDIPRAVIVAPGVSLELFAADAAGADNGLAPVPAVAGVVDQLCRPLDDRHLLDPAAALGRVGVARVASAGDVQVSGGGGVISAGFRRPGLPPAGPPGRYERHSYASEQGNHGRDGHDNNDQARPVHDIGPLSRLGRAAAGLGGSALGGAAR